MTSVTSSAIASSVLRTPGQNQQIRPDQVRPVDSDEELQRSGTTADSGPDSQQSQSVTRADNETSASNARQDPAEAPGEQQVLAQQAAEQAEFSQRQSQVDDNSVDPEPVSDSDSQQQNPQAAEPVVVNQQQRFSSETELFTTIQSFGQAEQSPEQGGEVSIVV